MAKRDETTTHDEKAAREATQGLVPLSTMRELQVSDDNPDVRGWSVRGKDGTILGRVKDLLVDRKAMKVRYLDVTLDRSVFQADRRALIPVGVTRIDDDADVVRADLSVDSLRSLPAYEGQGVTREYESSLHSSLGGSAADRKMSGDDFYDDVRYDERGLFGRGRRRDATGIAGTAGDREARLTLAEEQLAVGKRQVESGAAYLRKTVETEHVRESVPVQREELRVERHPLDADARTDVQIGGDEIRIPLVREELVVEKRAVPVEEVVLRKEVVTEERTVEADLRRERLDESALNDASRRAAGTAGTAGGGAASRTADRLADKLDDAKDRVDGNPASRPGRDATDREAR
jgi:uncharacterized protein (TIGR02271 family)